MSIRTRILLGFAVAFLACATLGAAALYEAQQLNATVTRFGTEWLPHVNMLGDLRSEVMEHRRIVLHHVLSDDAGTLDELEEKLADETGLIDRWFDGAGARFNSERQSGLLAAAKADWIAYRAATPKLLEMSRSGIKHLAEQEVDGDSNVAYHKLIDSLNTMRQLTVQDAWIVVGIAAGTYRLGWWLIAAALATCAAVCAGAGLLTVNTVCRPVLALAAQMGRVATGELGIEILGRDRRDEIGAMAHALERFREDLVEAAKLAETQAADHVAKDRHTARVDALVAGFDGSVVGVLQTVTAAAAELDATARSMTGIAADTTRQAGCSAEGARQATVNVQTVAASAEELAASLREIAHQVGRSTQIVGQATEEARATDANVTELAEAASRIGEVVQLISSIAGQTNLLALNATIEAARAGEAGKGFAVVAAEVKALASQTGRATEDIARQISAIQGSTGKAVDAIGRINTAIAAVSEVASGIAAAVEQQTAAVGEISRSAADAAQNTAQVSDSVATLTRMSGDAGAAAAQVLGAAEELARQSATLRSDVGSFIAHIRAA